MAEDHQIPEWVERHVLARFHVKEEDLDAVISGVSPAFGTAQIAALFRRRRNDRLLPEGAEAAVHVDASLHEKPQ